MLRRGAVKHPLHDVAIVGAYNTRQALRLDGSSSDSITLEAIRGVLDDGYPMMTNIVGCDHADVHVGMRVAVEFRRMSDAITLPYFRPSATADRRGQL
ncbi:MAG: OB-fold domain-containing protein [Dehalococcoidia bacterium]